MEITNFQSVGLVFVAFTSGVILGAVVAHWVQQIFR